MIFFGKLTFPSLYLCWFHPAHHYNIWREIAGSIAGLIGVAYVVLEFIPSIEPPANMREADAGWGAEQVLEKLMNLHCWDQPDRKAWC